MSISSPSLKEYFPEEISRLVNHTRETEVYVTLDNRTIADVYDLIAFNANNNEKSKMPVYVFTGSWFVYDVENKMVNYDQVYDLFRKNISQIQNISDTVHKYLDPVGKMNTNPRSRGAPYNELNIGRLVRSWLKSNKEREWPISHQSGYPDWKELNKIPEINQALELWTIAFVENDDHIDTATYLGEIYNTVIGNELYASHAYYPQWQKGFITQSSVFPLNDEIKEKLLSISDKELLSDEWIGIPWTRKEDVRDGDVTPSIDIDTWPFLNQIYSIDNNPVGKISFDELRSRRNYLYDYIEQNYGCWVQETKKYVLPCD